MEYDFYLEQKYLSTGRVEARILTASQAEEKGYDDGFICNSEGYKLYVDGFDSEEAACHYVSNLIDCDLIEN